jgi:hypothetical protein
METNNEINISLDRVESEVSSLHVKLGVEYEISSYVLHIHMSN